MQLISYVKEHSEQLQIAAMKQGNIFLDTSIVRHFPVYENDRRRNITLSNLEAVIAKSRDKEKAKTFLRGAAKKVYESSFSIATYTGSMLGINASEEIETYRENIKKRIHDGNQYIQNGQKPITLYLTERERGKHQVFEKKVKTFIERKGESAMSISLLKDIHQFQADIFRAELRYLKQFLDHSLPRIVQMRALIETYPQEYDALCALFTHAYNGRAHENPLTRDPYIFAEAALYSLKKHEPCIILTKDLDFLEIAKKSKTFHIEGIDLQVAHVNIPHNTYSFLRM
jgi:hypothetical protein